MSKRQIWLLLLAAASLLELSVVGYHQVLAQATTTATPVPATATTAAAPAGTAAMTPTATAPAAAAAPTQSYAATVSSLEEAPSGYTTEAANLYYDYVFAQYLEERAHLRTGIDWSGPFWIALWAGVLIVFFFLYALYFQNVHREHGELYGSASFAGAILERIGRVALFSMFVWTIIVLVALYYIITHILWGQVY